MHSNVKTILKTAMFSEFEIDSQNYGLAQITCMIIHL